MSKKTVCVWKASKLTKDQEIPSIEISIITPVDENENLSLNDAFKLYQEDAILISEALFESLPQGTLDRLIVELMGRKAKTMGYMGITGS